MGDWWKRACRLLAAVPAVMMLALVLIAGPEPAGAQIPDYSRLLGQPSGAEEPPRSSPPAGLPSRPLPASRFDPDEVPSGEAYGALTGVAADESGEFLVAAGNAVGVFRARLVNLLSGLPEAPSRILTLLEANSPTGRPIYFVGVAIFAALLLAIGRGVGSLYNVYVARPIFVGMQVRDPHGYSDKLPLLCLRVVLTIFGSILTIGVAALMGIFFYEPHEPTLATVIALFAAYGALMVVDVIWRMMLAPFLPQYRIPLIGDRAALGFYRWLSYTSGFSIGAIAFCYWAKALGVPTEVHAIATIILSLATVVVLITAIAANRQTISSMLLAGRSREESSWMAILASRLWLPLAAFYMVASWGLMSFDLVVGADASAIGMLVPYLVLIGGIAIYAGTCWAIERVFERSRRVRDANRAAAARRQIEDEERLRAIDGEMAEEQFGAGLEADVEADEETGSAPRTDAGTGSAEVGTVRPGPRMRTMEDLARRVASLFAVAVGAYALLYYWGGGALFAENAFFGVAEDLIDTIFLGYVIFHAVRIWIDQKIEDEGGIDDAPVTPLDGEGGGAGATRLATLLPLVRNFVLTVITISVVLIVAMELGVNVAPLFAGAGILGLAIGFGSQTLVRDVLSGAFFLLDDAFRKGEYLDVGDVKGTVEKISLRSFQLRHHLGMLHTIPFGEVKFLTNFSRDWVMMKLPLRLTYDTDVERVRKLVKKLGIALLEDATIGDLFLQPLKSQGVIQMEDSAMIVRVKFMTRPGDQWVVRKRVYQEIRDLFDREGIKFAHREVLVRIPELDQPAAGEEIQEGTGPAPGSIRHDPRAIGAAARTAVDVAEAEQTRRLAAGGMVDDR